MKIIKHKIEGVREIVNEVYTDFRGFFVRIYDEKVFKDAGLDLKLVQQSHSNVEKKNTLKGFHIQLPPYTESKLIRAIKGEVKWIVVDMRKDSKTFGKWDATIISDKLKNVLYIERGFAHGSITLTDDVELLIETDNYFSPDHGVGINWKDKDLDIDWGLNGETPIMLDRDNNYPSFKEFKRRYDKITFK